MDKEYQQFIDEAKDYARLRYKMLKLEFLEKTAKIVALIGVFFILIVLTIAALAYFSVGAVYALKDVCGSLAASFCIVGAAYVVIIILFYLLRKKLILNPLIKHLSAILFKENE